MPDLTPLAQLVLYTALVYLAGIGVGLWLTSPSKDRDSHTETEIAEEGEKRVKKTDVTYMHHTRRVLDR